MLNTESCFSLGSIDSTSGVVQPKKEKRRRKMNPVLLFDTLLSR